MNHKTKYYNCWETLMINQDSLMILLRRIFVKFGLQSLYIVTCRCYYHTLSTIQIVCVGLEFLLFAHIYFTKDMIQQNVNFLTSSLLRTLHILVIFFPSFSPIFFLVCLVNNGKLGIIPFFKWFFFSWFVRALIILARCVTCIFWVVKLCYSFFRISQVET